MSCLRLRPFEREHLPLAEPWFSDAATQQGAAVGHIDCGTHDQWATWEGGPGGRGVIGTIDIPAGSIGYVVDPALRRRGYCTAMAGAVLAMPELDHVELFAAGARTADVLCWSYCR